MSEEQNSKKKQFRKSHSAYMEDIHQLTDIHRAWRGWTKDNKKGFFPIFSPDFSAKAKDVSGNAIKLYLYLGSHIDNQAGYTLLSVDTMATYFNTSKRTVHNWLRELKQNKLIIRVQPAFKQPTQTFLLPYHDDFLNSLFIGKSLKDLIIEYSNEEVDLEDSNSDDAYQKLKEMLKRLEEES